VTEVLPGRALLDIDRETRAKLQAATDAALERALERAGNRLRAKGHQVRATLARVPPRDACATLGPSLVAAAGLDDDDLLAGAWDQLEQDYYRVGGSAQKRALFWASKVSGGMDAATRASYGLRQATDLDTGWAWMKENLQALAKAKLYTPDLADPGLGEFDPTTKAPTGLIRQAMRRAGGVQGSADLTKLTTDPGDVGSAWITVPDGSSPGGIATGQLITDIIQAEGGAVSGYRWVYGPADRTRPFHPHLRLDGLVFASFTDPRLVCSGWPGTGHYIPGDHRGCVCDVEPIVLTADQVAALHAQGLLPDSALGPVYGPAEPGPWHGPIEPGPVHGPARPGPEFGPTKAPPPLGDVHGPALPPKEVPPRLGVHRLGTRSYAEAAATVATRRTGAGRGFAFDGPDVESMHVHVAPVQLQKSTAAKLVDATEYRFKLTDVGARQWREAVLPGGDTVNRRGWRAEYQESLDTRKAAWKGPGWTLRKGVRVPDPGIAAQGDGLAQINLGKATTVRNKGGTKLSWAKADDAQQARWTGKFQGRQVTIEYSDVAANDRTATALHNEVRVWVEGTEAPSEDFFADLMERHRFVRRVGVPDDAEVAAYAEHALVTKLGTAEARQAIYGRSGGQVGFNPATATKLTPDAQRKAVTDALADIRQRFGIGPEDLALGTSADGRTVVQLTDQAVQRLVDETGVTFFKHDLHHSLSRDPKLIVDMLTGDQGGLLASRRRMADGLPFGGMSADRDYETGGADFVFTRQQNVPKWQGARAQPGSIIIDNDRLRDLDWFAYRGDYYGQTHLQGHYGRVDFVEELREGAGRLGGGSYGQETMFRDTIDFGHVQALYLDRYTRDDVLARLRALGVTHVGMAPIEDVVRLAGETVDLDPVLVPGSRTAPRRFDPGTPPTTPPPVAAIDPFAATVATNAVQSVGPTTAIAMIENGSINASAHPAWAKAIKEGLVAKYNLADGLDKWGPMITDYGWDIANNDSFGAKLIAELAAEVLADPAEVHFIQSYYF